MFGFNLRGGGQRAGQRGGPEAHVPWMLLLSPKVARNIGARCCPTKEGQDGSDARMFLHLLDGRRRIRHIEPLSAPLPTGLLALTLGWHQAMHSLDQKVLRVAARALFARRVHLLLFCGRRCRGLG